MSGITQAFRKQRPIFIPYLTVGFPDLDSTYKACQVLEDCGAKIIELGIPFSDPIADGPVIQEASFQALKNGINVQKCLQLARRIRGQSQIPLIFMTYFNPILHYGLSRFCQDSAQAGIDGLIVPDLPLEESMELEEVAKKNNLDLIYLIAPTSSEARIAEACRRSRGFIYLVSLSGVTGARGTLPEGLMDFIGQVKKHSRLSVCVGFGLSTPEQASIVAKMADGIIIGSRVIQILKEKEWPLRLPEWAKKIVSCL